MRHLAQVRRIQKINPIEGADSIESARVGGWNVVVKKGEYSEGDLAVYFEIDSWVPHSLAPFLSNGKVPKIFSGIEGAKLKTVRLRGSLSQGLLMPLSILPPELQREDEDVTEFLRIVKWEAPDDPVLRSGAVRASMLPFGIPKTDAERIQNIKELPFGEEFQVSLKLDGTSCTLLNDNGEVRVFSRSIEYKLDDPLNDSNAYCMIGRRYKENVLSLPNGYAIRGEIMGPKIQGNREGFVKVEFFVFDVWDSFSERPEYIRPIDCYNIATETGFKHVPVIMNHWVFPEDATIDSLLQWADNTKSIVNPVAEGLVFKHVEGNNYVVPGRRFKVISNKFLLKQKE